MSATQTTTIHTPLPVLEPQSVAAQETDEQRVARNVDTELLIIDKYGAPDVYVNGETDTDWFHWQRTIWVKPLRFENRTGTYVILLKTTPAGDLGKHRHRGDVNAFTIKGSWGYKEYDWTAKPGDFVCENPGTIHTLSMGADTEILFTSAGSIEFFNDDGKLREIIDLFGFWRMYVEHCTKHNLPINEKLWY